MRTEGEGTGAYVVWRTGDALLAAPLEDVVEVSAVEGGQAVTRTGRVKPVAPEGLAAPAPRRAIVLRGPHGVVPFPADEVEEVATGSAAGRVPTPEWLGSDLEWVRGLLRLDDHRVAALLAVDRLPRP